MPDTVVPAPEHREFPDWPLEELRTKKATADLYRMVYGPLSAQWIMTMLGFPEPPKQLLDSAQQLNLRFVELADHAESGAGQQQV